MADGGSRPDLRKKLRLWVQKPQTVCQRLKLSSSVEKMLAAKKGQAEKYMKQGIAIRVMSDEDWKVSS